MCYGAGHYETPVNSIDDLKQRMYGRLDVLCGLWHSIIAAEVDQWPTRLWTAHLGRDVCMPPTLYGLH